MNLVQKMFFVGVLLCVFLVEGFGQEDPTRGELLFYPIPPVGNSSNSFGVQFQPKVKYFYESSPPQIKDFSDEVELLWLFSDGNYITEMSNNNQFMRSINDIYISLHSNARYKPTDPIRYNILPIHDSGSALRVLDSGHDINIIKSWDPVSDDTDTEDYVYYIITIENGNFQCEGSPINGIVRIDYPPEAVTITNENVIIHESEFEFLEIGERYISYMFYNLNSERQEQRNLVIKALVKDNLPQNNMPFLVEATMTAGIGMKPNEFKPEGENSTINCSDCNVLL
ncbi:MAG: hypothetical protein R3E32_12730 [Chitinophagales bacterium]